MPTESPCFQYTLAPTTDPNGNASPYSFFEWHSTINWASESCGDRLNNIPPFIQQLKNITVFISGTTNYGIQTSQLNFLSYLRKNGYKNLITVAYDNWKPIDKEKVFRLLNIPMTTESDYYDSTHHIRLIDHLKIQLPHATLANCGFPKLVNAQICVGFSSYTNHYPKQNNFVSFQPCHSSSTYKVVQLNTSNTYLPSAVLALYEAEQRADIKNFLNDNPGLHTFIELVKQKLATIIPVYGWSTSDYPCNLLNIILGARYAQLNDPQLKITPMLITTFYDAESTLIESIQLMLNGTFSFNGEIPDELQKAITRANLSGDALSVLRINDTHIHDALKHLEAGRLYLLSLQAMPKLLFDALFAHSNMLTPVREGASSYSVLIQSGLAHLHCIGDDVRTPNSAQYTSRIDWSFADEKLRKFATNLESIMCTNKFDAWENNTIDAEIGHFIIEAKNPTSPLSAHFQHLQSLTNEPTFNRFNLLMMQTMDIMSKQSQPADNNSTCIHIDLKSNVINNNLAITSELQNLFPNLPTEFTYAFSQALAIGAGAGFLLDVAESMLRKYGFSNPSARMIKMGLIAGFCILSGEWMASGGSVLTAMVATQLGASQEKSNLYSTTAGCVIKVTKSATPLGAIQAIAGSVGGYFGSKFGLWAASKLIPRALPSPEIVSPYHNKINKTA